MSGSNQGRSLIKKSGLFDPVFYLKHNPDIRRADMDALRHFLEHGWKEHRNPSAIFNVAFYLNNNPDVQKSGVNPLSHFIRYGYFEGRSGRKDLDSFAYWCHFSSQRRGLWAKIKLLRAALKIHKSGLFDKNFYLKQYPDVLQAYSKSRYWEWRKCKNPILQTLARLRTATVLHYVFIGAYEGRDPNQTFSTRYYVNNNLDILQQKNLNPLLHYLNIGFKQGRQTKSFSKSDSVRYDLRSYTQNILKKSEEISQGLKVAILVGYAESQRENKVRFQTIFSQRPEIFRIYLFCGDEKDSAKEFIMRNFRAEEKKIEYIDYKFEEEGLNYFSFLRDIESDLIWIIPNGYQYSEYFLQELIPWFTDQLIMAACCATGFNNGEPGKSTEVSIHPALQWVNHNKAVFFSRGISPADYLIRNPFWKNGTQQVGLEEREELGFEAFLLEVIKGGAIACSPSISHRKFDWKKEQSIDLSIGKDVNFRNLRLVKFLYHSYDLSLGDTIAELEKIRSQVLISDETRIDDFLKEMKYEQLYGNSIPLKIMISIVAFSLGGGEIMPIRLANQLRKMGHSVLVHSLDLGENVSRVREMLDASIPVVTTQDETEMAMILNAFNIQVVNTHHQANQSFIANVINADNSLRSKLFHIATSHGMYENFNEKTLEIIFQRFGNGIDHWTYVADKNLLPFHHYGLYKEDRFTKISNGMQKNLTHQVSREAIGLSQESFVCCIASRAIPEKGWHQAIEAVRLARTETQQDIQLILLGEGSVYDELIESGVPNFVHLLGFQKNPCDYYSLSNLCLVPSFYRSESAPLSLIEALLCEIPVVSSEVGEVRSMLSIDGDLAGDVIPLENWIFPIEKLAKAIANYIEDQDLYQRKVTLAAKKSKEFDIRHVAENYLRVYEKCRIGTVGLRTDHEIRRFKKGNQMLRDAVFKENSKRVSVIVPTYNHEKYLRERLDSIYQQTYRNFEVLLLDDCSSDISRKILQEYAQHYPENTRVLFNDVNSGGVYHQWAKGILHAKTDYCWIAESDDHCERNFLEKVMAAFDDPETKISYANYGFINVEGVENPGGFFGYVGSIDDEKWRAPYIEIAEKEVVQALGIKNTIPNASGMVFRKPLDLSLLEDDEWLSMRICGDWIFYLHIVKGGKIAYTTSTKSYFRFHHTNTSVATYATEAYYKEHEAVAIFIKKNYDVPDEVILRNYENIHHFFKENVKDGKIIFEELFDLNKVLNTKKIQTKTPGKGRISSSKIEQRSKCTYRTILVNPILNSGKDLSLPVKDKVLYTGNNTGNLLFVEGMKEQLDYSKEIWFNASSLKDVEGSLSMVLPSSNFIIHGGDNLAKQVTKFLEQTKHPFTMAGLGAQSTKVLNTPKKLVEVLTPTKIRFFKMAAERAVSLGVRGDFTAQCLEEMGIYNYRIIGCPSTYKYMGQEAPQLSEASSQKVLMNLTTGRAMETHLLELGMKAKAAWIMQMMTEMPEMAFQDSAPVEKEIRKRFPRIKMSGKNLKRYMQDNAHMFFRIEDWENYLHNESFSFSFGSRFHGNMCALRNGIPALWIVHDSRTTELVHTLHLPFIDQSILERARTVDDLIPYCDYTDFYKHYQQMKNNYVQFLDENQLNHHFA